MGTHLLDGVKLDNKMRSIVQDVDYPMFIITTIHLNCLVISSLKNGNLARQFKGSDIDKCWTMAFPDKCDYNPNFR